jgi:predicted Zn-dependent protease
LQRSDRTAEARSCQQDFSALVEAARKAEDASVPAVHLDNEGVELETKGNLDGALEKYRAAVELDPSQTVFRRNLALLLCRLGRWQEGIRQLREVLKNDPADTEATRALYIAVDRAKNQTETVSKP